MNSRVGDGDYGEVVQDGGEAAGWGFGSGVVNRARRELSRT